MAQSQQQSLQQQQQQSEEPASAQQVVQEQMPSAGTVVQSQLQEQKQQDMHNVYRGQPVGDPTGSAQAPQDWGQASTSMQQQTQQQQSNQQQYTGAAMQQQQPALLAPNLASQKQLRNQSNVNDRPSNMDDTDAASVMQSQFNTLSQSQQMLPIKKGANDRKDEIRIKWTDTAKSSQVDALQPLIQGHGSKVDDPSPIPIKVNFALADGARQNFSQPIYSGIFEYIFTVKQGKRSNRRGDVKELSIDLKAVEANCHIDQRIVQKSSKVIDNLKHIIEKAIMLQPRKLNYWQDNFFQMNGQMKNILRKSEEKSRHYDSEVVFLRLRIQSTPAHQNTMIAKGHFAELGMSSNQQPIKSRQGNVGIQQYPDQLLDQITFPEPLHCTFTMTQEKWSQLDDQFNGMIEHIQKRLTKAKEEQENDQASNAVFQRATHETGRKLTQMREIQELSGLCQGQQMRTYKFKESGLLQIFLMNYKLRIDDCLKSFAMDPKCKQGCFSRPIYEFGLSPCTAKCGKNAERSLTQTERTVILFSMIYVERDDLDPDTREHLWLRAAGATQFKTSYEGYKTDARSTGTGIDYYKALEDSPITPNSSVGTIKADQRRISFDLSVIKKRHKLQQLKSDLMDSLITQNSMQNKFAKVMINYHKRNGAFIYNQSQSEILIRILEVVYSETTAFWLYSILNECILPLNFYTNTLFPQAFLDYTINLVRQDDQLFFERSGDAINMFCLKSYYSLFTNLEVDPSSRIQKSEMAYFMLDLLFLLGDPNSSTTMLDNQKLDGVFNVGETIPRFGKVSYKAPTQIHENKVRIDRTSQLLLSMSITIADFVKQNYLRSNSKEQKEEQIRQLSGFEEIVRTTIIDKSSLLTQLLSIEIFFFSKRINDSLLRELQQDYSSIAGSTKKRDYNLEQLQKWLKNNQMFGEAIDKTREYTDRRFDKKPRIKQNMDNDQKYLDKAKFLTKFSCFDGYMQYVDSKWDVPCHGVDYKAFKKELSVRENLQSHMSTQTSFYNNYHTEEILVARGDCRGTDHQPICLYDFTVKTLAHDSLNFSTRHMIKDGHECYINQNYMGAMILKQPPKSSPLTESFRKTEAGTTNQLSFSASSTRQTLAAAASTNLEVDRSAMALSVANGVSQELSNHMDFNFGDEETKGEESKTNKDRNTVFFDIQQPFEFKQNEIPPCIPIFRGIHLCSPGFTSRFKASYATDSNELASQVKNFPPTNYRVQNNSADDKKGEADPDSLFSTRVLELLYAKDIFGQNIKIEGSLSNARCMSQLRQFYLRMIDKMDQKKMTSHWETQRTTYTQELKDIAKYRGNNGRQEVREASDGELALKRIIRNHSDLAFQHWGTTEAVPNLGGRPRQNQLITVLGEGQGRNRTKQCQKELLCVTYRHLLTEDKREDLPFANAPYEPRQIEESKRNMVTDFEGQEAMMQYRTESTRRNIVDRGENAATRRQVSMSNLEEERKMSARVSQLMQQQEQEIPAQQVRQSGPKDAIDELMDPVLNEVQKQMEDSQIQDQRAERRASEDDSESPKNSRAGSEGYYGLRDLGLKPSKRVSTGGDQTEKQDDENESEQR